MTAKKDSWGLAIETSGSQAGSGGVIRGDEWVDEVQLESDQRSAQALVPALHELLRRHALRPQSMAWLGLSLGPGSFTGLRVGITLAKLFAYSTQVPLIGVPTTEVLAWQAEVRDQAVLVVLDAQRRQFFVQLNQVTGDHVEALEPIRIATDQQIAAMSCSALRITGPGVPKLLRKCPQLESFAVSPGFWTPTAKAVAARCLRRWRLGDVIDPMTLAPIYVRPSAAEDVYRAKHGGGD